MSTLIFDLEVENWPYMGQVASPRHASNYIVAPGWAYDNGPVQHLYFHSKEESHKRWLPDLTGVEVIVAHNAAFELDWIMAEYWGTFVQWYANGGRIFCTQYAEYLLSNQTNLYPTLDETAPKYGGTHKIDEVKILWEQGKRTSEIDPALLIEYLAGPGGDIENTRKVYYGQATELIARGMWSMMWARCDGLVYNAFAMSAGLHVDAQLAYELKGKLEVELATIDKQLEYMYSHITNAGVEFNLNSDYHMSAWLFGGSLKRRWRDVWCNDDGTPKFEKDDFYKFEDGWRCQKSWFEPDGSEASAPSLADLEERVRFAVQTHGPVIKATAGKLKGKPRVYREDTAEPKMRWYEDYVKINGLIDLNVVRSYDSELAAEWERDFTGARKLNCGTPVYSTGKDALEPLSKIACLPEHVRKYIVLLLKRAKIDKDLGTYYLREVLDEAGNVIKTSGMLQYLGENGIVNHVLNCTSTITTRLSSNRPNFQNIPRGDTSDVKSIFTSRYDNKVWLLWAFQLGYISKLTYDLCTGNIAVGVPNGVICEADYSALEVVTLAGFSRDTRLMQALLDGTDMHCMRLSAKLNEPYADVLLKCKNEDHPDHAMYSKLRTDIKPRAFAYQYGASALGIAWSTGCSVEDAQAFIDTEKSLFPGVEAYFEDTVFREVESNTQQHNELSADGGWQQYSTGVFRSGSGTCYEFRQWPKKVYVRENGTSRRINVMAFKPTQMRNFPIQGESAFFVQLVAGMVARWLAKNNFFGGRVFIINQVHDALYLDIHLSVVDEVCAGLKKIMESLPDVVKSCGWYDLSLPFPVEVKVGPNMRDEKHWNPTVH